MSRHVAGTGVIVGENDTLMRGIIRSVLMHVEPQVFPAANGLEAVVLARQFKARLVLLDIAMPHLNGLLACEAIRALPGYADVPVVMLTGYDDGRLRQAALRLGARDFITKPFRPDLLLARLAPYLGGGPLMPAGAMAGTDSTDLVSGREMMRICRSAEKGPQIGRT
jgi:DNA-binding response OmpR family regulator